jgi:hypothetical protein
LALNRETADGAFGVGRAFNDISGMRDEQLTLRAAARLSGCPAKRLLVSLGSVDSDNH